MNHIPCDKVLLAWTAGRDHRLTPVRMAVLTETSGSKCWHGGGGKGILRAAGGNVRWCSRYGGRYGGSSKNEN